MVSIGEKLHILLEDELPRRGEFWEIIKNCVDLINELRRRKPEWMW